IELKGNESYIETPLERLGEDNKLTFDLKLEQVNSGDILFETDSPYGTHDIRIMEEGKLGFTRELHEYVFDYKLPKDKWVNISIETTDLNTILYVNGEFIGSATGSFIHNDMVKKD